MTHLHDESGQSRAQHDHSRARRRGAYRSPRRPVVVAALSLIAVGAGGMAANKVAGARAALCNDLYTARLSRQHNDANVLSMGGRIVAFGLADEIVALWLETAFEGGRHQRRIDQIRDAERGGS